MERLGILGSETLANLATRSDRCTIHSFLVSTLAKIWPKAKLVKKLAKNRLYLILGGCFFLGSCLARSSSYVRVRRSFEKKGRT